MNKEEERSLHTPIEINTFRNKEDADDRVILESIYNDYSNYFTQLNHLSMVNDRTINDLLRNSSNTTYLKEFENIINVIDRRLLGVKFPFIKLHGDFDSKFTKMFSIFNLEYQPELKKSYVCMFFLNFILEDTGMIEYEVKREEIDFFQNKIISII